MTPKEKAEEFVSMFQGAIETPLTRGLKFDDAKYCALMAVNEILSYHDSLFECGLKNVHQTFETPTEIYNDVMNPKKDYWQQVRKEIETL